MDQPFVWFESDHRDVVVPRESPVPSTQLPPPSPSCYPPACRDSPIDNQRDGGHVLRMRGRCLSRQLYVEAISPGQNPGDQVAAATEDALAPRPLDAAQTAPTGQAVATGLQVRTVINAARPFSSLPFCRLSASIGVPFSAHNLS